VSTLHQVIFVLGLFGVPLALLVAGHRLKRKSVRRQHAFWGAVLGHGIACGTALVASLVPPIGWLPTDVVRGAFGLWGLVALPLIGAGLGSLTQSDR
jgi:hypothetical protein